MPFKQNAVETAAEQGLAAGAQIAAGFKVIRELNAAQGWAVAGLPARTPPVMTPL